jgi:release factor glutamine methyltransferase
MWARWRRTRPSEVPILTVKEILDDAAARLASLATARRDAELLMMRAVRRDRAWLLTHGDEELAAEQTERFHSWVARRARHEPIQYIVGEQEFYGLSFKVTPAVLIPRPETEHLVEETLRRVARETPMRIGDVGVGSGAIAVALAKTLPLAQVTAVDISRAALDVARENAERNGVAERMRFIESDLLNAVAGERFEVIVSNPPYVAESEELEPQVREWEPRAALFAGPRGLEVYERLIPQAWDVLVPGGWLLLEIGQGQREALAHLLRAWNDVEFVADLQRLPRVAIARRGGGE